MNAEIHHEFKKLIKDILTNPRGFKYKKIKKNIF